MHIQQLKLLKVSKKGLEHLPSTQISICQLEEWWKEGERMRHKVTKIFKLFYKPLCQNQGSLILSWKTITKAGFFEVMTGINSCKASPMDANWCKSIFKTQSASLVWLSPNSPSQSLAMKGCTAATEEHLLAETQLRRHSPSLIPSL